MINFFIMSNQVVSFFLKVLLFKNAVCVSVTGVSYCVIAQFELVLHTVRVLTPPVRCLSLRSPLRGSWSLRCLHSAVCSVNRPWSPVEAVWSWCSSTDSDAM